MDTSVSRRSFLGGALAVTAIAALPLSGAAAARVPVIYGDGDHDDTAGLQALLDGKPFRVADETADHIYVARTGNRVYLSGGMYRVSRPIQFGGDRAPASIIDVHMETIKPFRGPAFHFDGVLARARA